MSNPRGLAKLFRTILSDLNITPLKLAQYLNEYIQKQKLLAHKTLVSKIPTFNNLFKPIFADELSFKTFLKALKILNVTKIEIPIKLYHAHKNPTIHRIVIDLSDEDTTNE